MPYYRNIRSIFQEIPFRILNVTIGTRNKCFSALGSVYLGQNSFGIIGDF